ncbi:MAG: hypothetical protein KDD52_06315, partial [Bdellovibrionales bacterium]|nr:hypothetical protein [Bdellovibrionales bacterium]
MSIYNASVILAQKSEKIVTKYKDLYTEYGQVDLIKYGSEKEESANNFYNYLQSIVNEIYQ